MLEPAMKSKLWDIYLQLMLVDGYLVVAADRGSPMKAEEIKEVEERLHKEIKRIYRIFDSLHRR